VSGAGSPHSIALTLHPRDVELEEPLSNASSRWVRRSLTLLELSGAQGATGWGEASPLPGYSRDEAEACRHLLHGLDPAVLQAFAALSSPRALLDAVAALVPEHLPAARFGLETALLDRLGRHTRRPLCELLREAGGIEAPAVPVPLCALLPSGEPERAVELARAHRARGVSSFKLKVGPGQLNATQDRTLVALRAAFGGSVQLRLDANRSLNRATLADTLARAAEHGIEFLEEPIAAPEPELLAASPCPLALDESLQGMSNERLADWLALGSLRALVLKPSALGGFGVCLELARAARLEGRAVIVSHTLEGPIGWAACAHLALALGERGAAGLWPLPHQHGPAPAIDAHQIAPPREPGLGVAA